jgi:hypothetical protein
MLHVLQWERRLSIDTTFDAEGNVFLGTGLGMSQAIGYRREGRRGERVRVQSNACAVRMHG